MIEIMRRLDSEQGMALVVTVGLLFLITLLGLSVFRWSMDEIGIAANQKDTVQAQYLAEAGPALVLQWFQEPESFPDIGTFPLGEPVGGRRSFLKRRMTNPSGSASFIDDKGQPQFLGTAEQPDFWYQSEPDHPGFLHEAFGGGGDLTSLKIYAPTSAGALCTVEATGMTGSGIRRTVSVEIIPSPVPPTTAPLQIGPGSSGPVPVLVHWGEVRVMGEADFGSSLGSIPKKISTALVGGQPYTESGRQDPWIEFYVGGAIVNPTTACQNCSEPFLSEGYGNLHQFQTVNRPGFGLDHWDYQNLKTFAKTWGVYFGTDREGFLYQDGNFDPDHRRTPSEALAIQPDGNDRGLVFVDTVDQKPPDGTNMATLDLPVDYMEGLFSIQAHLTLRESGSGRSIQVQAPPSEDPNSVSRETVVLPSIQLKGVLSTAGQLVVEGHPKVFGALIAQQGVTGAGQPEIWYDAGLRTGYYTGLPTVTLLKGSWYIR
jgi:hypothetical protein